MAPGDMAAEPGVREYLLVLARRRRVVALCTLAAAAGALTWSLLQPTRYAGRAEVLLQPRNTESLFEAAAEMPFDPVRAMQTEIRIVTSEPVRAAVRQRIGGAPKASVKPVGQTDLIRISAIDGDPERAAEVANTYASAYVDFRRTQAVDEALAAAEQLQGRIGGVQREIDALDQQVASAPGTAREGIRNELLPREESLLAQQARLRERLDQLQVAAAIESGGALLVTRATPAPSPVSPRPVHDAAVAAGFGLVLGIGLALLLDHLDDSVATKDDLDRLAPGLPVLGLIPAITSWSPSDGPRLISLEDPTSPAAEAYRTVRTSVRFMAVGRRLRALQVTSASAEEGKTTTLVNLAVALAGAGQRVTILCCDLRRPRVHEFFGLTNHTGFTSVLLGGGPVSAAIQKVDRVPGLSLMASGKIPPNPSELLSATSTEEVIGALRVQSDILLIDSPPVLPVTDALILAKHVDATLLVTAARITTGKELRRALELLDHVNAPVVGAVLNGVLPQGGSLYDYRSGTGESSEGYRNSTLSAG